MDVNACLAEIRKIIRTIEKASDSGKEENLSDEAERLAYLVKSLDQWMTQAGAMPQKWASLRTS